MTVSDELKTILNEHGGMLYPKDVVDYARNPDTELHSKFDWNDSEAAEKYRLWQARKIIRVNVTVLQKDDITINTYVSLKADRYDEKTGDLTGGYRSTIEVMKVPSLRKTLLEEALEEHDAWEAKYQAIVELAEIFVAARSVKQKSVLQPKEATA